MAYDSISAAVVGTGFMGPAHVEALRRLGVRVAGMVGSNPVKSAQAAARLGVARAYDRLEDALEDDAVDAVHITSPNRWHHAQVSMALAAGKHVLCEKPLAMNPDESADLVEKAAASGKICAVNYNIRFYPLALEIRERVREMGRIHSIVGSYVQDWLLADTAYNWRVLADEGGALRAVADIGTHWMDLVTSATGRQITAVMADLKTIHPVRRRPVGEVQTFTSAGDSATEPIEIKTEDQGAILLRFDNGATGVLWVSQVTAGRKNRLHVEISGETSALAWDSEAPNELWIGHGGRPNELLVKDPGLVSGAARYHADYPGGHAEGYPDSFKQCFRAFYDAILARDNAAPYPTFADGHREIVLCDAILRSAQSAGWVEVAAG
ncbi:MAG: Gfo/Idh/MocA family oxidoreductase [Fimbriimonadaceae bacterium]|nr:Gfo/Idh/MocA family oxidoreductase [Fimbriimonadaceae bacterium]